MTQKHQKKNHPKQSKEKVHGGEHRNGRLSQFKNHSFEGEPYPSEFLSKSEE
ncbi:hypothetical protein [Thermoflavimicrobium daqui]|uniref:hypothetical protein n=1 Tax=Thermoflavimicrobium daqui TaxID=2137476 RepID=UPI00143E0D4E|nr:hypothetical protein [Thermoflavimicrobium daqui]